MKPRTASQAKQADRLGSLMAFRLNEQNYALPIETIVQIIPMVTITSIPQVNPVVEGVINLHGLIVPVINMHYHLGLPETPRQLHTPILIINTAERALGLIVDEVIDVLDIPAHQIARPSDLIPEELGDTALIRGVAYRQDGMLLVLDSDKLFHPDTLQALSSVLSNLPQFEQELAKTAVDQDAPEPKVETSDAPAPEEKPAKKKTTRRKKKDSEESSSGKRSKPKEETQEKKTKSTKRKTTKKKGESEEDKSKESKKRSTKKKSTGKSKKQSDGA